MYSPINLRDTVGIALIFITFFVKYFLLYKEFYYINIIYII